MHVLCIVGKYPIRANVFCYRLMLFCNIHKIRTFIKNSSGVQEMKVYLYACMYVGFTSCRSLTRKSARNVCQPGITRYMGLDTSTGKCHLRNHVRCAINVCTRVRIIIKS